jgi:hypothetical protein
VVSEIAISKDAGGGECVEVELYKTEQAQQCPTNGSHELTIDLNN